MPPELTLTLSFPLFDIRFKTNHKELFSLITRPFPSFSKKPSGFNSKILIDLFVYKTAYSKLPRSRYDCFHGFTVFYNRFAEYENKHQGYENSRILYDIGPRTLRTVIDPQNNTIASYVAVPPDFERDLLFDLVFFQPLKCLLQIKNLYLFHASCVVKNKKAVLFSGKSGSGKSTLALTLLKNGFDYFADDEIILHPVGGKIVCSPFFAKPKLLQKSLSLFPELKNSLGERSFKKDKILVNLGKAVRPAAYGAAMPALLIFPKFIASGKTRLKSMDKQKALSRISKEEFIKVRFSGPQLYKKHFLMLANLIRQAQCYTLLYRDSELDKIPGLINSLLKETA